MANRRRFLTLLGVGAAGLAGCRGNTESGSTPAQTTTETPSNNTTETPVGEGTPTETVEEDLTGEELYFNWVHGGIYEDEEHEEIMESVQGTGPDSISFQQINNALEETEGSRVEQVANAVENAANQYTQGDEDQDFENRHRHIMSAVHQTLEQRDEDFEVYSMADWAKSTAYPNDGIDYSKIWVENENGQYTDINAMLQPDQNHTTHIEGQETNNDREEVLQMIRNPESAGTRPAHDYEALQNSIDVFTDGDEEYSDEQLEEINGSWLEEFENYTLGEGNSVPSSTDEWSQFHEGMEAGPQMMLGLTEQYHSEGYGGESSQFTVEDEVDGSVSMEDVPDGYDVSTDGVPGTPAA